MNNTLRQALRKTRELRQQVENLLLGDEGDVYETELKKFVARRPCWGPKAKPLATREYQKFELYLHDKQKNGGRINGFDLENYLKETGLINRALSLEDELVKGWLENPRTYPEELKGKAVFLWKSTQDSDGNRGVACLCWLDGRVVVRWGWLVVDWDGSRPALLAP